MDYSRYRDELEEEGFIVLSDIYSAEELTRILQCIEEANKSGESVVQGENLFYIEQLTNVIPALKDLLLSPSLIELVQGMTEEPYFMSKAVYYGEPGDSFLTIGYHQDSSISVRSRAEVEGYENWSYYAGHHGVIPPVNILSNSFMIRIHFDDAEKGNGGLKVIPRSHKNGFVSKLPVDWVPESEHFCEVKRGGVMAMKPLAVHAPNRAVNGKKRRVLQIEFSKDELTSPLQWLEKISLPL